MESIKVKDFMVRLHEYATVPENSTLGEAILALEEANKKFDLSRHRHRAILVLDKSNKVIGKISQMDVLRAIEPKYKEVEESLSRAGYSPELSKSMIEMQALWRAPLRDLCGKAAKLKVKDFMYTPTEDECIDENAPLGEATHRLVMGRHQSLLVTLDKKIVGILRLTDVFMKISEEVKTCES